MKLHPEDLEVVSFPIEIEASLQAITIQPNTLDTNNPTPQTYCFVCD